MLPKASRFTRREFDALIKGGRVRNYPLFSLRLSQGFAGRKVGMVISKKEVSLASLRNKARRRAYTAVRPHLSLLPLGAGAVFFLRKESLKVKPSELGVAMGEALKTSLN